MTAPDQALVESHRLRPLLLLCAVGVALRAVLLWLASGIELQSDEANYVYAAITWNHFGVYFDHHRYLWPPGYAWFLAQCLDMWGVTGLTVARTTQVLASGSIGFTTMLFAFRLFGMRAARIAGWIWIAYLPLAAYSHLLYSETLFLAVFLPALYLLLRTLQAAERMLPHRDLRIILAGVLFAAALHLKEAPLYLTPILGVALLRFAPGWVEGARRGSLFLLVVVALVLPWSLRNQEVYGRFTALGTSLGENAFNGLNEEYRNFDLLPIEKERARRGLRPVLDEARPWFIAADEGSAWERQEPPDAINLVDRSREHTRRGVEYARAHPGWFVRSRIRKLADVVNPPSFYTRHQALGRYDVTPLGGTWARRVTALWALACPLVVLALGSVGVCLCRTGRAARWIIGPTLLYFAATATLVAMSRFRIPVVPLFIVFTAGLCCRASRTTSPGRLAAAGALVTALAFLWWIPWPETWAVFVEMVWRPGA